MQSLWLVTIPNGTASPDATFEILKSHVPHSGFHKFVVPNLVVGTLDSLMALSDDLVKINSQVEVVLAYYIE